MADDFVLTSDSDAAPDGAQTAVSEEAPASADGTVIPDGGAKTAVGTDTGGSTTEPEPAVSPAAPKQYGFLKVREPAEGNGPIEWVMSTVIRKLAWSRLSQPRVAISVAAAGLLLGMIVGAMAPNTMTLPYVHLPLSHLVPSLKNEPVLARTLVYMGDILACLGLAGMLWAHSQGWRPNPRRLFWISTAIVAVMVSLNPVSSSDTASYAAYGRIVMLGGNPYLNNPYSFLHPNSIYVRTIGTIWKTQPSVYGPVGTVIQAFAAWVGGPSVSTTIYILMILNGLAFVGVGYLLLKTSDDPIRATLFWTANPVLLQQLVSGGHLDTFVAAAAICVIQVARRVTGTWGDILVGVLIGLACGVKITAVLIGIGLAWPLLWRHEWMRVARMAVVAMATVVLEYSFYGLRSLKPLLVGSQWISLPSPWWLVEKLGEWVGIGSTRAQVVNAPSNGTTIGTLISVLWVIAMFVVAWLIYQRISSDQPGEVVAPFALTFAWVIVAPWEFAWYTAIAWVTLTQVPRNRMTRWLAIFTVYLALWHSSGGQAAPFKGP